LSRRQVLMALGGLAVAPAIAACTSEDQSFTLPKWRAERGERFFVAHRGSGDVFPEHSLEAYEGALSWGAKALEISVVQTSDGVLICQHDLTFDRTTNLKGKVATQPSSVLLDGRIDIPWLGPRWQGERRPRIARLDDVLRKIEKRAVLFIEPKDDNAFPGILRMVKERQLQNSVMFKLHYRTQRIPEVRDAGMSVFCYIGDPDEVTPEVVAAVVAKLDKDRDVLVVPAAQDDGPLSEDRIRISLAGGVPVWVFPAHRRWEAEYFHSRGVQGIITSSYGYVARSVHPARSSDWQGGAISAGEMTRFPDAGAYAIEWPEAGVIALSAQRRQAFLTLGNLAPLERSRGPYKIAMEIRVDALPADEKSNFSICFAHDTDAYYEHRQGTQNGYHAILRMDGSMELRVHEAGSDGGDEIARTLPGPAPVVGAWIPLEVEVDTKRVTFSRLDTGATTTGEHSKYRGDYIHVGRSAMDGRISVRNLRIS
jgi:hypothetical protein